MLLSLLPLRQYCKRDLTPGALNVALHYHTNAIIKLLLQETVCQD